MEKTNQALYEILYTDRAKVVDGGIQYRSKNKYNGLFQSKASIKSLLGCLDSSIKNEKKTRDYPESEVFMTAILSIYERIYSKYDQTGIFKEEKGMIIDYLENLKHEIGEDYNQLFIKAFLRKNPFELKLYKNLGFEDLKEESFGMLFETFYDKPDNIPNEEVFKGKEQDLCFLLSLAGRKGVLKYLIDNNYTNKEEYKEMMSDQIEYLWQFYYYGVAISNEDNSLKPLVEQEREKYLLEFFDCKDFIYLYKKGIINLNQLSENVSIFDVCNSTYNHLDEYDPENPSENSVFELGENKEALEQILNLYFFSENELMEVLGSKEYKQKVNDDTSDIIWLSYLSGLISIDNLKKLENTNTHGYYKYLNIDKVISKYLNPDHLILSELELKNQDKIGLKKYFTFDKIIEIINDKKVSPNQREKRIEFLNTYIRNIYEENGINFEEEIVKEQINQSEQNNVEQNIINLYDIGLINDETLFKSNISTDKLVEYYIDKRTQSEISDNNDKGKNVLFKLSEQGKVDIIDVIDILQKSSPHSDKEEDDCINDVYGMVGRKELSINIIKDYLEGEKKSDITTEILEKYDSGLLDTESVKELSVLFDYNLIQNLYNEGRIEYETLKGILDEDKAKEVDEKYDIYGKIEELKKNGGIQGIEVDYNYTGIKRKRRHRKNRT